MNSFREALLRKKIVSVWGLGYLGYTTVLEMQARGFAVRVWDYLPDRLDQCRAGAYPDAEVKEHWSLNGEVSPLKRDLLFPETSPEKLLESPVQIICLPTDYSLREYHKMCVSILADAPATHETLALFLPVSTPGFLQQAYSPALVDSHCHLAGVYRTDWHVEEMPTARAARVIASSDPIALQMAAFFYKLLELPCTCLSSHKAGEIFALAVQVLEGLGNSFVNQLAFTFSDTDIRELTKVLFSTFSPRQKEPSMGHMDIRYATSFGHLLDGANPRSPLSMLEEAQRSNISTLMAYADLLLAQKVRSVAILGLPALHASQRDVRASPSLILSEYLHNNGVTVFIHSPDFAEKKIKALLPFAVPISLETPLQVDAVLLMADQLAYRSLGQDDLDRLGISKSAFCFDNPGLFKSFTFSPETFYHNPGDGRLAALKE